MPFARTILERAARLGLAPRTRLARFTTYLAGIELVLVLLRWLLDLVGARQIANPLAAWTGFLGLVLSILAAIIVLRWFRNHVMWSLRNRLIVTYLFIGGVPVTLVLLMAVISGYFFAGQFAASLAQADIQAEAKRLQSINTASLRAFGTKQARAATEAAGLASEDSDAKRSVMLLDQENRPNWLKDGFSGLVLDHGKLYLRAANLKDTKAVVSSVPVDLTFLSRIGSDLGAVTLYLPPKDFPGNSNVQISGQGVTINGRPAEAISTGNVPAPQSRWDRAFDYYAVLQPVDWQTGKSVSTILTGTTRVSTLYSHLAGASEWASVVLIALAVTAVTFGVIVLIALLIGLRLTRTITYSVANLYRATQHINRGDFDHRIQVREKDQLAALQVSFNSMAESLKRLIAEQKEKERLQSELEIAHEVQAQLFPHTNCSTVTLELHGVCRPARIVSGDYYDFLCYAPDQVGIAVGDISGKGISAALLMATIHSAVRAYEQEQLVSVSAAAAYGTTGRWPGAVAQVAPASPAQMLWLLNRHLYQSTQPEKYATLFLGFYDGEKRQLTYSNAGHLAPIILSRDGSVRRLEAGGMVVGLFDNMEYEEETVEFKPGDIFVAFSDGMTEPENEFGEFGEDRLIETIAAHRDLPLERLSAQAVSAVQDWIGSTEQPDDITLVLAREIG